ncbi:hypothetical protein [Faecalibacillus intestinalis]|uniref:hypothetical protein n=1 Tax=Faecalibacillus intestinalis TaxID=1982626 RepID=UPI00399532AD
MYFITLQKKLKVMSISRILVTAEIRYDAINGMDNIIKGAGGYPVGVGGKALLMMSEELIHSVAGYLT